MNTTKWYDSGSAAAGFVSMAQPPPPDRPAGNLTCRAAIATPLTLPTCPASPFAYRPYEPYNCDMLAARRQRVAQSPGAGAQVQAPQLPKGASTERVGLLRAARARELWR
jgi:hypothetical protein